MSALSTAQPQGAWALPLPGSALGEPSPFGPLPADAAGGPFSPPAPARASFAHESEAEMARILDFYAVRWEYEPHTFPILWNLDGDVVESFSPDFYLPELDLYLEITTLRQKLVRKKNRKLRRLRELYPGLQVKLFYARDFRALMLKYGKLALAGSLSGTLGQVGPAGAVASATSVVSAISSASDAPATPTGSVAAVGSVASAGAAVAPAVATVEPNPSTASPTDGAADR